MSEKLLLTAREAAEMLSVSTRTLWTITNEGKVPSVRIGRSVRYPLAELVKWVSSNTSGATSSA